MTATQNHEVGRRRFMQGIGATAAAGAGLASMSSASAVDAGDVLYPQSRLFDGAMSAGAGVGAWLGDQISGVFDRDYDLTNYTGSAALYSNIEERALQLNRNSEATVNSLANTVDYAENAILPKAMMEIAEAYNDEKDLSEIQDIKDQVVNEYFTDVKTEFLTAHNNIMDQVAHIYDIWSGFEPADSDDDVISDVNLLTSTYETEDGIVNFEDEDYVAPPEDSAWDMGTDEIELPLDGVDDFVQDEVRITWNGAPDASSGFEKDNNRIVLLVIPESVAEEYDYDMGRDEVESVNLREETIQAYSNLRWKEVWDEMQDKRLAVLDELGQFIDDFDTAYDEGDVDLADAVDPITAYTELRDSGDADAYSGAAAGMLGIPSSGTDPLEIELMESEVIVQGGIYSSDQPEGGFSVGEEYDPENKEYPIFLRYSDEFENEDGEIVEESDFVQIEQPFTILEALDEDGEERESVEMEEGPTYDPADVESIEQQLAQVREAQIEIQERAAQQQSSGIGFGFLDGDSNLGLLAIVGLGGLLAWEVLTN